MVNKQYTIQHTNSGIKKSPTFGIGKRNSPPPVRSISIISDTPNPQPTDESSRIKQIERSATDYHNENYDTKSLKHANKNKDKEKNYEKILTENDFSFQNDFNSSIFGSNIAMSYDNESLTSENNQKFGGQHHFEVKDCTINDIGRFQYILQMDREMNTQQDSLYSIPSRTSTISSHNNLNYWKADSKSPITSTTKFTWYSNRWRHDDMAHRIKMLWKYSKWPIFLLISCIFLAIILFFLFVAGSNTLSKNNHIMSANYSAESEHDELNYFEGNDLEDTRQDENFQWKTEKPQTILKNEQQTVEEDDFVFGDNDDEKNDNVVAIVIKNPRLESPNKDIKEINFEDEGGLISKEIEYDDNQSTARSAIRNTQILKITTQRGFKYDEEDTDDSKKVSFKSTNQTLEEKRTILTPMKDNNTKNTPIGFTSGHQNNFGVPIEEDERILKMLNEELIRYEEQHVNSTTLRSSESTTAKVSPTIPFIIHHKDTSPTKSTTEATNVNSTDAGICSSTSLDICQGILQYDLTTLGAKKKLQSIELDHFKYLFDSECSARAAEFVCSALEPECRPSQMGILQPCKRICKSILEPCASIIASSEILTMTFDCDRYPDSSDRNVCEDPTRRGTCLQNEFLCLDSTCIPAQWKCDNIKDCSLGEDEENCIFCDHEEFRCHSNDKCIDDKWRCDQYDDCPDGSDEADCFDYEEDLEAEDYLNSRIYSFASIQLPNNPDDKPFTTIPDEENLEDSNGTQPLNILDEIYSKSENNTENSNKSIADNENFNDDEIQKGEASGRVVVGLTVPKNLANFQDSKEIMMTSDSEYSAIVSRNRNTSSTSSVSRSTSKSISSRGRPTTVLANRRSTTTQPTTLKPLCPDDQLRCVSGKCIKVDQLCDRKIDCPDGADEAMCVYKSN